MDLTGKRVLVDDRDVTGLGVLEVDEKAGFVRTMRSFTGHRINNPRGANAYKHKGKVQILDVEKPKPEKAPAKPKEAKPKEAVSNAANPGQPAGPDR